ncbi:MAG: STAS/SEC14 domain-containing protein [Novipirellula sp. JB048]
MLKHRLLLPEGMLLLEPDAPLEAADFEHVAAEIDPYITRRGKVPAVLIHAASFPGWANLAAAIAHLRFVETHHAKIGKLAIVSDSPLLAELPLLIGPLIDVEVKHFPESAYHDASVWLLE